MKIWTVTTEANDYDTYDAFVVVAESAQAAVDMVWEMNGGGRISAWNTVGPLEGLKATKVDRNKAGIVLGSFNAG